MNRETPNKKTDIGRVLRERAKQTDNDIGELWADQKKIREEDELLQRQYKRSKQQAKQLKKKIRSNQYGDTKNLVGELPGFAKSTANKANKLYGIVKSSEQLSELKKAPSKYLNKKRAVFVLAGLLVLVGLYTYIKPNSNNEDITTATLGESNSLASLQQAGETTTPTPQVPTVNPNDTEFMLLFPTVTKKDASNTKVARVSPQDKVPAYAYTDRYQNAELQVSQQELPTEFRGTEVDELDKLAKSFQATNVIEINGEKVYHGYSTTNGEVQSLLFIKNELLVFIASDKKLVDELWVSYITSLK